MSNDATEEIGNRLLRRLPAHEYQRLEQHLVPMTFASGEILYEPNTRVRFIYFPTDCVLSAVTIMEDGEGTEVGTIGNEGGAGLTAFLGPLVSPHRVLVQVPGAGVRIDAEILRREAANSRDLYNLLLAHHHAFLYQVFQSVACNGLHPLLKRCCRWLLMTHDRVIQNELPLTHEFLSFMLAVRRSGVTEALQELQQRGLISNSRGSIMIIDRPGLEAVACECYHTVARAYDRLLDEE